LNDRVNDRFAIVTRQNEQDLRKIIIQNHKYFVESMFILQQIRKRAMHERETMFMLH
jgi:hypothetical protein